MLGCVFIAYILIKPSALREAVKRSLKDDNRYHQAVADAIAQMPAIPKMEGVEALKLLNEEAFTTWNNASAEITFEEFCLSYLDIYKRYNALEADGKTDNEINEIINVEFYQLRRDLISGEIKEDSPSEGWIRSRKGPWDLLREQKLFEEFLTAFAAYTKPSK